MADPPPDAPIAPAYLVLLQGCGNHRAGARFDLVKSPVLFGRAAGADVVLDHGTMSRRHGRFEPRDGAWWVVDVASTSGVFVNDETIGYEGARKLADRDTIRFGQMELRISHDPAALDDLWKIDDLTGLHTEGYMDDVLGWMSAAGVPFAVAEVEVDRPPMARLVEHVVPALGQLMRATCPPSWLASRRWSTFRILMPRTGKEDAVRGCEVLREAASQRLALLSGQADPLTLSIGVAVDREPPNPEVWPSSLAGERLRAAQAAGGNRVVG